MCNRLSYIFFEVKKIDAVVMIFACNGLKANKLSYFLLFAEARSESVARNKNDLH
jgi:hypothetical protein